MPKNPKISCGIDFFWQYLVSNPLEHRDILGYQLESKNFCINSPISEKATVKVGPFSRKTPTKSTLPRKRYRPRSSPSWRCSENLNIHKEISWIILAFPAKLVYQRTVITFLFESMLFQDPKNSWNNIDVLKSRIFS